LLHPFAPFLTSFLYDKLYSASILFSERDGILLKKLIESLEVDSLERAKKSSVLHQNCVAMSLFYRLLRKVREFKNKYSFQKENLTICLVLLPSNNKDIFLISKEIEDVEEKFNSWLKKLTSVELNYISLPRKD
jgi:valyl-tRNA synthetase